MMILGNGEVKPEEKQVSFHFILLLAFKDRRDIG